MNIQSVCSTGIIATVGMTRNLMLRRVIAPQLLRHAIPGMSNV